MPFHFVTPNHMNSDLLIPHRWFQRAAVVLTAAGAIALGSAAMAAPQLSGAGSAQPLADQNEVVPVKVTFEKNASAKTEGPYVMTLTNTADHTIKVGVRVDQDVTVHNRPKARHLGPEEIAPGKDWKVDDLAALDKVTVTAEGFAPLQIVVQAKND